MEDKVFGTLEFHVGWTKKENISLWGMTYDVRIRTSSKRSNVPSVLQQEAYKHFQKDQTSLLENTKKVAEEFVLSYSDDIAEYIGIKDINNPLELITPQEVLFFQNGKYAIVCDTKWSEAGMAILVDNQKVQIDEADILEFEY